MDGVEGDWVVLILLVVRLLRVLVDVDAKHLADLFDLVPDLLGSLHILEGHRQVLLPLLVGPGDDGRALLAKLNVREDVLVVQKINSAHLLRY